VEDEFSLSLFSLVGIFTLTGVVFITPNGQALGFWIIEVLVDRQVSWSVYFRPLVSFFLP